MQDVFLISPIIFLEQWEQEDLRKTLNLADLVLCNPTNFWLLLFCAAEPLGKELMLKMPVLSNSIPEASS